jgi:hypothetical protein
MSTVEVLSSSPGVALNSRKVGIMEEANFSIEDPEKNINGVNRDSNDLEKVYVHAGAEAKLVRKLDTRLIPLLFVLCMWILDSVGEMPHYGTDMPQI